MVGSQVNHFADADRVHLHFGRQRNDKVQHVALKREQPAIEDQKSFALVDRQGFHLHSRSIFHQGPPAIGEPSQSIGSPSENCLGIQHRNRSGRIGGQSISGGELAPHFLFESSDGSGGRFRRSGYLACEQHACERRDSERMSHGFNCWRRHQVVAALRFDRNDSIRNRSVLVAGWLGRGLWVRACQRAPRQTRRAESRIEYDRCCR